VAAAALTIWSPQIFETNVLIGSPSDVADRHAALVRRQQKLQAINALEDVMDTSSVPTFLACGAFFVLSFVTIWAFWFVERLRGANAPHL
jgi:hypothetical protein